jgi:hypothetical protein
MELADVLFALLLATPIKPPPADQAESPEDQRNRLEAIAHDAADVARQANPGDPVAQARDALLLLAVAHHESGFARDFDIGPCRPNTCDHGAAACMLQIHGGSKPANQALFDDRWFCFRLGLHYLHHSRLAECPGEELQFVAYAGGSCAFEARLGSKELYAYWQTWLQRYAAATLPK